MEKTDNNGRKIFDDEEIMVMEAYKKFVEEGEKYHNKWSEFLNSNSELKSKFDRKKIARKIAMLEKKFEKEKEFMKMDPEQQSVVELCECLWGKGSKRRLVIKEEDDMKKKKKVKTEDEVEKELMIEEFELYYKRLLFEMTRAKSRLKIMMENIETPKTKEVDENTQTPQVPERQAEAEAVEEHVKKANSLEGGGEDIDDESVNESPEEEEEAVLGDIKKSANDDDDESSNESPEEEEEEAVLGDIKKSAAGDDDDDDDESSNESPEEEGERVDVEEILLGDLKKRSASRGSKIKVHYTAKVKGSDKYFESTIEDGADNPVIVTLGGEGMIDGFAKGVQGMHVGGKRRLTIPPSLGFGEEGIGEAVPPNSWLEYEVELLGVRPSN